MKLSSIVRSLAVAVVAVGGTLVATPAQAEPADHLVINEAYLSGGSAGAAFRNKFIELHNPTDETIDLAGWSLQYRSATGANAFMKYDLTGEVGPDEYFLVAGGSNGTNGELLPAPDATTTVSPQGSNGVLALVESTNALPATFRGNAAGETSATLKVVDLLGYGTGDTFEGTSAVSPASNTDVRSNQRTDFTDTDDNRADFTLSTTITPCTTAGCPEEEPEEPPVPAVDKTIPEIQGPGAETPFDGVNVRTTGVVTAVYRTGGFDGAYIQTEGTGGDIDLATRTTSDGLFVYSAALAAEAEVGDHVEVEGEASEYFGLTQVTADAAGFEILTEPAEAVKPAAVDFPLTEAQRESLEGMLLQPEGDYTVTNNFTTNQYAEVGLAAGDEPLPTPTNVARPRSDAYDDVVASNARRLITLDDGASTDFLGASNQGTALPWLTGDNEVRVGAPVTFESPVVLDYRFGWKLQPQGQLVAGGDEPVTFGSTRTSSPVDVGGDVKLGNFNVLNYFSTTATDYVAAGNGNICTYYTDREGNRVTGNRCGNPTAGAGNGPRGAAEDDDLKRQQDKIVAAINTLDADVVSLEEIENSITFSGDRDEALATLVEALNDASVEEDRWAFVPSPAEVPASEDVIRTAFIYQADAIETVGESRILIDDPAFDSARDPLAQAFRPVGAGADATFVVSVNHFKSKGSGTGADADQNDGQGASNYSRTLQAAALVEFVSEFAEDAGTDQVFLTGDFNSYNEEDPVQIIEEAGFVNVERELTDKDTYQFDGQVGSLDHVFASDAAFANVTGADIWNINAYESIAREYSRTNYNATDFHRPTPYRSSDHDPAIVGYSPDGDVEPVATTTTATSPTPVRFGAGVDVSVKVASASDTTPTGTVTLSEGDDELVSGSLEDGAATLDAGDLTVGTHTLTVDYAGDAGHEASTDTVTVTVLKAAAQLSATVGPAQYGTPATVTVTGAPGASGLVYVVADDEIVGMGSMTNGTATVRLVATLPVGSLDLDVYYAGNLDVEPSSTSVGLTVAKASTTTSKQFVTGKIVVRKTQAYVTFDVKAAGFTVDNGTFRIGSNGKWYTTKVVNGRANVRVGAYNSTGVKTIKGEFLGNGVAQPSKGQFTVNVVAR